MLLNEMKRIIDALVQRGNGNKKVVITTKNNNSTETRASVEIKSIIPGFDSENNEIRIEPDTDIITANIPCLYCKRKISLGDKYCKHCGKSLKE